MVTLLIGVIGSGKEDHAKYLADHGAVVISDLGIVRSVHAGNERMYRRELREIYTQVELAILISALDEGRDVVVNRTNLKKARRHKYIEMAERFDSPITAIVFPRRDAFSHAKLQVNENSWGMTDEYWVAKATQQLADWEEPRLEEGFDNIVPAHLARQMMLENHW